MHSNSLSGNLLIPCQSNELRSKSTSISAACFAFPSFLIILIQKRYHIYSTLCTILYQFHHKDPFCNILFCLFCKNILKHEEKNTQQLFKKAILLESMILSRLELLVEILKLTMSISFNLPNFFLLEEIWVDLSLRSFPE